MVLLNSSFGTGSQTGINVEGRDIGNQTEVSISMQRPSYNPGRTGYNHAHLSASYSIDSNGMVSKGHNGVIIGESQGPAETGNLFYNIFTTRYRNDQTNVFSACDGIQLGYYDTNPHQTKRYAVVFIVWHQTGRVTCPLIIQNVTRRSYGTECVTFAQRAFIDNTPVPPTDFSFDSITGPPNNNLPVIQEVTIPSGRNIKVCYLERPAGYNFLTDKINIYRVNADGTRGSLLTTHTITAPQADCINYEVSVNEGDKFEAERVLTDRRGNKHTYGNTRLDLNTGNIEYLEDTIPRDVDTTRKSNDPVYVFDEVLPTMPHLNEEVC